MELHKLDICVAAGAGQRIEEAIREALILSAEERCRVVLNHNDTEVILDAQLLIEEAYRQWSTARG